MASFSQEQFVPKMSEGEKESTTRLFGFELEVMRKRDHYEESEKQYKELGKMNAVAGVGFDGGDIEVATNPYSLSVLLSGDKDLDDLFEYFQKKEMTTSIRSGTHINVSKLESDSKYTYDNILWLTIIFGPQIKKVFGRSSTWAKSPVELFNMQGLPNKYTEPFGKDYCKTIIDIFMPKGSGVSTRFSSMHNKGLLVTDKGNRYEFRGGKSTTSFVESMAWTQFCNNIVEIASKRKGMEKVKFKELLKGSYIEDYFKNEIQTNKNRRLSRTELAATINSTQEITIMEPDNDQLL